MKNLIVLLSLIILVTSCCINNTSIAGPIDDNLDKIPHLSEYILHLYGEGKFNVILTDNNTTKIFNVDLFPSELGFQVVVGGNAFGINFPCQVVINNLNKSTAVYILGDLDLLMDPKITITTGIYGQFRSFIESVRINIDINGNIN